MASTLGQPFRLPLSKTQTIAGAGTPATAASGAFGYALTNGGTTGGTTRLLTEVANATTVSDKVVFDFMFPFENFEASSIPLNVLAGVAIAAGATATVTLTASVREVDATGTLGAELVTSGSPVIIASGATVTPADSTATFAVNSASLGIGDEVMVTLTMQVVGTGSFAVTGHISGVTFGP